MLPVCTVAVMADTPAPTADRVVVLSVVSWLGVIAVVLVAGSIWLIHDSIRIAPDGTTTVSAAVAPIIGLAGTALGALGALLASTRTGVPDLAHAEQVGFQKAADLGQALAALPSPAPTPVEGEAAVVVHGPVVDPPAPADPSTSPLT